MVHVGGYLFDELAELGGSRLTQVFTYRDVDPPYGDELALGTMLDLPDDQDVDVESDFLTSHLPFHVGGLGGVRLEGQPWLFVVQKVPSTLAADLFGVDDPFAPLRWALDRALTLNEATRVVTELTWTRQDLELPYRFAGVTGSLDEWAVADLLQGLLAECCGVSLAHIANHYPGCAFSATPHSCEHDVFSDIMAAWAGSGVPDVARLVTHRRAERQADLETMTLPALRKHAIGLGFDGEEVRASSAPAIVAAILNDEFPDSTRGADAGEDTGWYTTEDLAGYSLAELRTLALSDEVGYTAEDIRGLGKGDLVGHIVAAGPIAEDEDDEDGGGGYPHYEEEELESLSLADLKDIASDYGIEIGRKRKPGLIAAILQAQTENFD